MADIQWQPMDLPSRGVLYRHPETREPLLPEGKVLLRKMMTEEDAILLSQGHQGLDRMTKIVTNCCQIPGHTDPKDPFNVGTLLITDRMAVLLALRTLTFRTPWYRYTFRCQFCGATVKASVNLATDLPERNPETIAYELVEKGRIADPSEFVLEEPIEVHLPDSGIDLQVRFLRGVDEERIAKRAKRVRMATNDAADSSYLLRLALQIVRVNGEEMRDAEKELFVRRLSSEDSAHLRIQVDELEPGLDLTVYPSCTACGADNEMSLPFTAEFFRPTNLHA